MYYYGHIINTRSVTGGDTLTGNSDTLDAFMLGVADGREAQTRVFKEWLNNSAVLCRENPEDNNDYCYVISKDTYNTFMLSTERR